MTAPAVPEERAAGPGVGSAKAGWEEKGGAYNKEEQDDTAESAKVANLEGSTGAPASESWRFRASVGTWMSPRVASPAEGAEAAEAAEMTVPATEVQAKPPAVSVVVDELADDVEVEAGFAGPSFVDALANVLTHLAGLSGRPRRITRFHAVRAPQLSLYDYLMRIATYFQCSHECFVLGLVYIDRIVKLHPEFTICTLNIHRLLLTSVMLGAKFFDDVYFSNSYYAKVGGVRTQELNALEALFMRLIEWRLHVRPAEYEQYRNHVLTATRGSSPTGGPRLGFAEPSPPAQGQESEDCQQQGQRPGSVLGPPAAQGYPQPPKQGQAQQAQAQAQAQVQQQKQQPQPQPQAQQQQQQQHR